MKRLAYLLLLAVLTTGACKNDSIPAGTPSCIVDRIEQMKKAPAGNPGYSITRYSYKGALVYYIPPQCCDQFSQLLNDKCETICAPDGGLTGVGDGRCIDFSSTATNGTLIWKDPRGR